MLDSMILYILWCQNKRTHFLPEMILQNVPVFVDKALINMYFTCTCILVANNIEQKILYIACTIVIDFKDRWCILVFLSYLVKSDPDFLNLYWGFPGGSEGKVSACNAGGPGSIPGSGRSLEKEMATHSGTLAWKIPCMEKPVSYSLWWVTVYGVAKRWPWLSNFTFTFFLRLRAGHAPAICTWQTVVPILTKSQEGGANGIMYGETIFESLRKICINQCNLDVHSRYQEPGSVFRLSIDIFYCC